MARPRQNAPRDKSLYLGGFLDKEIVLAFKRDFYREKIKDPDLTKLRYLERRIKESEPQEGDAS